ncbi:hypothetical protein QTP70_014451, partial [Hemibagrus guttatus]
MEKGRASGIDGLPAEFYKAFWAVRGQDVLDVLRDSIRRGELPLSCRRAVLTPLPKKGRPDTPGELTPLHWLLEEPLVYDGRLDISGVTVPALSRTLISSGIVTLRELVNVVGSDLSRAEDLAALMGLRSLRVVNQLLHRWRSALTSEECVQLMGYQRTETGPAEGEPFPRLNIAPDLDGCAGPLLECRSEGEMDF